MNTCIDCGREYPYESANPLGSSTDRCCACRKKSSKLNKKIILLEIAGHGIIQCRKCGYSRSPNAIYLVDAILQINKAENEESLKRQAEKQFLLCANCKTELQFGEISMKVINSNCKPIDVAFYTKKVRIVVEESRIESAVNYTSDAVEVEVVTGGDNLRHAPQIVRKLSNNDKSLNNHE